MRYVRFSFKVIIIWFREKVGFNCKNNYRYDKSTNFWLDIINKINCKILIVKSYLITIENEKDSISLEKLQVICPIAIAI